MTFQPVLPAWLLLILMIAALGALTWLFLRHRRRLVANTSATKPALGSWLRIAGIVLCVSLALFRPGLGAADAQTASANLDVVVMVDTTSSSSAQDWDGSKTRLDGMKSDLTKLVPQLPGARWSLITFNQRASTAVPLTTDSTAFSNAVANLTPEITAYSHGSSITVAQDQLKAVLQSSAQRQPDRQRLVLYLGDGEQTSETPPSPFSIDSRLISGGVVMGYGTGSGAPMRAYDPSIRLGTGPYIKDPRTGEDAISKMDEKALKSMAGQLRLRYDHRTAGASVKPELDAASGTSLNTHGTGTVSVAFELYWVLALLALVLAAAEAIIDVRSAARLGFIALPGGSNRSTQTARRRS